MSCFFVFLCFAGCAGRNFNCEWPQEPAAPLDPSKPGQLRHISDDALLAEDLAIRYADKRVGKSSGNFKGADEYRRTREQCMTQLFEVIAKKHAITQEQVRQSLLFRRTSLDIAVIVSFAVLYAFVARFVAGRIWEACPPGHGWIAGAALVLLASAVVGFLGVVTGELWALTIEGIRIGAGGHMSYRADRVPWAHHRGELFISGMILFWVIAALRYRAGLRPTESSSNAGLFI